MKFLYYYVKWRRNAPMKYKADNLVDLFAYITRDSASIGSPPEWIIEAYD